jgi:hypothetical protein
MYSPYQKKVVAEVTPAIIVSNILEMLSVMLYNRTSWLTLLIRIREVQD